MSNNEKDLAWLLMQDHHYLIRSTNAKGKIVYKVMVGKQIPVRYFSEVTVRKLNPVLKCDAKKRMTINLAAVRQLNGNTFLKGLYKIKKSVQKKEG